MADGVSVEVYSQPYGRSRTNSFPIDRAPQKGNEKMSDESTEKEKPKRTSRKNGHIFKHGRCYWIKYSRHGRAPQREKDRGKIWRHPRRLALRLYRGWFGSNDRNRERRQQEEILSGEAFPRLPPHRMPRHDTGWHSRARRDENLRTQDAERFRPLQHRQSERLERSGAQAIRACTKPEQEEQRRFNESWRQRVSYSEAT